MSEPHLYDQLRASGFLDGTRHGPLYRQLADALRGLIGQNQLASGRALPPERELAEALAVSRITVRNAYRELIQTGELEVRRGSGTFVSRKIPRIEQPLWRLSSFSEEMRGYGLKAGSHVIARLESLPSSDEIILFDISPRQTILRLDRLRIADDMPVAIERTVVPLALVGDGPDENGSLYEALALGGHKLVRATQKLTSVIFDDADAALLDLEPGTACLLVDRVGRAADGRVVEHTRSFFRGDAYAFIAELSIGN